MKKIYIYIITLLLITKGILNAQGILISNGANISCVSTVLISVNNGSLINNGTFTSGSETVSMSGNIASSISGSSNTSIHNLIITNSSEISSQVDELIVNTMTIGIGGVFIIPVNKKVTANTSISNNSGASGLVVKASTNGSVANGSLIFNNDPSMPVSATVEMYTKASNSSGKYRYQYFGIPVRSMVASSLFEESWVNEMHENRNPGLWSLLNSTSALTSFTGYAITQSTPKLISFTGDLENGNKDYSSAMLTKSAIGSGGHLIGNPYTAAININPNNGTALSFGDGMDKTLFLYNTGSYSEWQSGAVAGAPGSYLSVPQNTAGFGGLPSTVPSMQAFIVHVNTADGSNTISIPYAAVIKNINQSNEMQRSTVAPKVSTRINVISASGGSDCMWLFSEPSCSHGFDNGWDGAKTNGSSSIVQLFSRESSGDYQVNTVDDLNNTDLVFKASNDTIYTFTFAHENLEMRYASIYLIDKLSNTITDISQSGSQYVFTASNSIGADSRFRIVVEPTTPDVVTSNREMSKKGLSIYSSKNKVFVNNPSSASGQLNLFDRNGVHLQSLKFKAGEFCSIQPNFTSGSYIAKATTDLEEVSEKIYLEQ